MLAGVEVDHVCNKGAKIGVRCACLDPQTTRRPASPIIGGKLPPTSPPSLLPSYLVSPLIMFDDFITLAFGPLRLPQASLPPFASSQLPFSAP